MMRQKGKGDKIMGESVTEVLRRMLDERGVEWRNGDASYTTEWTNASGQKCSAMYWKPTCTVLINDCTPEQAIAATLGSDDDYERKMDALLCRLTNGKWSKSRAYDLDFMEQCINEEFEMLYAKESADVELGSGTLTAEQVREAAKSNSRQYESPVDNGVWITEYDWQAIADELNATLDGGECCLYYDEDDDGYDGWYCDKCDGWFQAVRRNGHLVEPKHCQECGRKVVS